ncbi:hypothetical protein PVAND_005905 [Polypedilum vanderplanki]|uniref:Rab-GAP TBC domain-containing protein n=1 Tax=Polypedilum vanderplanki TaxID=319348 RepID=A0A9J6C2L5_POLVA|nr:hypothetical protein PVAND_005905 [Polypedilum vanderplanki]
MYGSRSQAVRVKVKKNEKGQQEQFRKFSVDPSITSLEVLYSILAKAFEIKNDFSISYSTINPNTKCEEKLIIFSDWDLDAAFLRAHNTAIANNSEPILNLQIDVKSFSVQPDWDSAAAAAIISNNIQHSIGAGQKYVQNRLPGMGNLIMGNIEKTFSMVSRALNLADDPSTLNQCQRPPLSDNEFRYYCDSVGQIIHQAELRKVIYAGGIEPSLRRVVWKHILNVYPAGLTGKERMDYMKKKSTEYYNMREVWRTAVLEQGASISGELAYVTSMVRKDVLRTDRHHPFYAGNDDNQNIGALFNVLTTYALNHPSVSYCQGMSDICSPILVTMCDEGQAYICFCALMNRLKCNFMIDGIAMTKKFNHLSDAIQYYDYEFYNYLKKQQADDLLFCYRWLLLEMKREFAFEDSLRMLEVLWSSLPADPPEKELQLFEREFVPQQIVPEPKSPSLLLTENPYTKVCALRRQNSAMSISNIKLDETKRMNQSLDETKSEFSKRNITKTHQSLDETKLQLLRRQQDEKEEQKKDEVKEETVVDCQEEKTEESPVDSTSEERNPFLYSDSTDIDLPSGSENSTPQKTITRGNSISETLKELKEKLAASKIGIMSSIEKLEEDYDPKNMPEVKLVKNFSEFLNFAKRRNSEESQPTTENNNKIDQLTVDRCKENKSQLKTDASPDDSQDYYPITTSITRGLKLELENLNRQVFGQNFKNLENNDSSPLDENLISPETERREKISTEKHHHPYIQLDVDAIEVDTGQEQVDRVKMRKSKRDIANDEIAFNRFSVASSTNNDIFIWQNPLHASSDYLSSNLQASPSQQTPDEQTDIEYDGEIIEMDHGKKSVTPIRLVRKNCDGQRSKRSSTIEPDSDSDDSDNWNYKLNANNPFYEQIQQLSASKAQTEPITATDMLNSCEEASEVVTLTSDSTLTPNNESQNIPVTVNTASNSRCLELPPPSEFGNGNCFLMFLCLTILLQHRDYIIQNNLDYNEMAMHFDKMVRKHNVNKVLNQARRLYQDYMRQQNEKMKNSSNNARK